MDARGLTLIPTAALAEAVVLVVDDQPVNVTLLERLLERAGVGRVVGITDPRLAVEHYRTLAPDLILLDLHMPHLDGVAVLEALLREMGPEAYTPVLVLTADTTLEAKERALAAGAKDFVTKPFEQSEVLLRVKNLLETRALHVTLLHHNAMLEAELSETAERERRLAELHALRLTRIRDALDAGAVTMLFQPIFDVTTSSIVGFESLARFSQLPQRPPNEWFTEAAVVGLGADLELLAVGAAVAALPELGENAYLSVNVSPNTALDTRLDDLLGPVASRIVLELTEHDQVDEYDRLLDRLDHFRRTGVRIAVDDAGSGYASLRHILRLKPDIIKLDIDLTRAIDLDPARRALAAALVTFADKIGAVIVAEGIETASELDTLRELGVTYGQGYHLARPGPLPLDGRAATARASFPSIARPTP